MIRVENLEKYYDRHKKNEKHVLQKINLELPSHGLIAVGRVAAERRLF